jgi:hypothetical protein
MLRQLGKWPPPPYPILLRVFCLPDSNGASDGRSLAEEGVLTVDSTETTDDLKKEGVGLKFG